jgi:DNA polymerase-4
MARSAARWLSRHELFARTVVIKVRYRDFTTVTRSHSERSATRDEESLAARAVKLLDRTEAGQRPVRLLGVSVHNLSATPVADEAPSETREEPALPMDEAS